MEKIHIKNDASDELIHAIKSNNIRNRYQNQSPQPINCGHYENVKCDSVSLDDQNLWKLCDIFFNNLTNPISNEISDEFRISVDGIDSFGFSETESKSKDFFFGLNF